MVDFLRAFFQSRWEGAFRAEYESLHGLHNEAAVINTRVEGKIQPFSMIPLISPSSFGRQMFVNHPQVSQYLLKLQIDFLMLQTDLIPEVTSDLRPILLAEVDARQGLHATNSLAHLAQGLPVYDVIFTDRNTVRVEQVGTVPRS